MGVEHINAVYRLAIVSTKSDAGAVERCAAGRGGGWDRGVSSALLSDFDGDDMAAIA